MAALLARFRLSALAAAFLLLAAGASADQIRVMTSGGFTAAYLEVIPEFERMSGHEVLTSFGASMGDAPDSIPIRLARGERADVVILAASALDALAEDGKVVAGSRVDLVRSTIGMVVRAGAPRPDISTVAALTRTLLDAKSIAYSASASGVYISTELYDRLGIADRVRDKSRRVVSERVAAVVARGEAEVGFQQVSELLSVPGVDYVGPLPSGVQRVTVFSAGVASGGNRHLAEDLIRFLSSPAVVPAIVRSGLEPASHVNRGSR
jgi:molybdate transport system substrate-binding protein